MRTAKATLIKHKTNDGLVQVWEQVPIGKEYTVDLDSRCVSSGYNYKKNKKWKREIINMIGDDIGWMPTELLNIQE